jgi:hypothetical protein
MQIRGIRDGKIRIRNPGWKKFGSGSGMEKIRIRDKHPGSATMRKKYISTFMKIKKFLTCRVQREVMTQLELRRFP